MDNERTNRREFLRESAIAAVGLGTVASPYLTLSSAFGEEGAEKQSAGQPHANRQNTKTKILLIGHQPDHPFGTHMYLHECGLLAKCLRQSPNVEAVVSDGWPTDAGVLEGVSAIVLYTSPGADLLFRGAHAEHAKELMKQGIGLTAIHWATGIRNKDDTELGNLYLASLGGIFGFGTIGLNTTKAKVEQPHPEHPVCRGWPEYDLKDEFYLNLKFLPEAKPIAKVRLGEKEQTVAWVYERPASSRGRSFGNTLGHFHENFCLDPFRRAIVNGILWTAHQEIPDGGAPCQLSAEDMKLERPKE